MRKSLFPFVAFAAILSLVPMTANAATGEPVTIRIPHGDLDLTSQADVTLLKKRIAKAVDRACRAPISYSGALFVGDYNCRTNAMAEALAVLEQRRAVQVAAAE